LHRELHCQRTDTTGGGADNNDVSMLYIYFAQSTAAVSSGGSNE